MKALDIITRMCCDSALAENASVWHYYKDEDCDLLAAFGQYVRTYEADLRQVGGGGLYL